MNKLRTHIVIHESFLLYFIPKIVARLEEVYPKDCSQVRGSGSTMFYEKSFRILKKLNASDFASSVFLQSASASTKI